jgi:hypothetical protein
VTHLSRSDHRTNPGVLTPGLTKKETRPEGALETCYTTGSPNGVLPQNCLPPLQGKFHDIDYPGVKTPGSVL